MVLTTDAICAKLTAFVAKWDGFDGTEKAGAQEYLIDLLDCYGQTRESLDARFEQNQGGKFMDMFVPGLCIFEMKRPSEAGNLGNHHEQAFSYWQHSADSTAGIEAARYVVICAFQRLEIWEPGRFPQEPRRVLTLTELPENLEAMQFLAGRQPLFKAAELELTRDAVAKVAGLNNLLIERGAGGAARISERCDERICLRGRLRDGHSYVLNPHRMGPGSVVDTQGRYSLHADHSFSNFRVAGRNTRPARSCG